MPYSDFTISDLKSKFNLKIEKRVELFPAVEPVSPSPLLREVLEENLPLALEIDTDKAR